MLAALLLLVAPALAWETDQLTRRSETLPDLAPAANAELDRHIAAAVAWTNARTDCAAPLEEARRLLARDLHRRVGRPEQPEDRGWPRNQGYNVYGAWLEQQPGARSFPARDDIYGTMGLWQGPVLHLAGTAATVNLGGVLVGVDKTDHFLGMGYAYWVRSGLGEDEQRAVAFGTRTERSVFGMWTSLAFSYADLEANLDGYRFYAALGTPGSEVELGADGCLVQARPFRWEHYVHDGYDELLNPSVYTRASAEGVQRALDARGAALCDELARAGGQALLDRQRDLLRAPTEAVAGRAPPRNDPYELERRCSATADAD